MILLCYFCCNFNKSLVLFGIFGQSPVPSHHCWRQNIHLSCFKPMNVSKRRWFGHWNPNTSSPVQLFETEIVGWGIELPSAFIQSPLKPRVWISHEEYPCIKESKKKILRVLLLIHAYIILGAHPYLILILVIVMGRYPFAARKKTWEDLFQSIWQPHLLTLRLSWTVLNK